MSRKQFQEAKPGTYVMHWSGSVHQLAERKADGSGWWLKDGSGLSDDAFAQTGGWCLLDADATARVFAAMDPNTVA